MYYNSLNHSYLCQCPYGTIKSSSSWTNWLLSVCAQSVRPRSLQVPLGNPCICQCCSQVSVFPVWQCGTGYTQEAVNLISPIPSLSTEHATGSSSSDATCGNTCKPLCGCRSSEARVVSEAWWDLLPRTHKNAELGKPSARCLGSLAMKAELWAFVSGSTTGYGKEKD